MSPSPLVRETPETLRPVAQPARPPLPDEVLHVEPLFSRGQMPAVLGVGALLGGLAVMLVSLLRPVPLVSLPITGGEGTVAAAGVPLRSAGGFDRAGAGRSVRAAVPGALAACAGLDTLGAAADVELTFSPDGHVAQAAVSGAQGLSGAQQSCLQEQLRSVQGTPFEGGALVERFRIAAP